VTIDSEVGRGTKVTVYLPRTHAAIVATSPQDDEQYISLGRQTILVVEDNPEVRHVAVSLLEQLGYRTIEVDNAAAALELLAVGTSVALVFSDVVLPGQTDGLALAHIIADRHPNIPVVLTTGYTRVFETTPEFPVLRKPYQISALGRVVQQSLNPPGPVSSMLAG
jgi:CheY-like chemotaxis protein